MTSASPLATLAARARTQARIIRALLIREMMTRYGRRNIGFLWLIGEPLILVVGIILIWSATKGLTQQGVPVIAFALTGYSLLTLWRHQVQRGIGCFSANAGLLFHQNVRFLDTLISRTILEVLGTFLSFAVAYLALLLFGFVEPVQDHLLLVGAWFLVGLFAFGVTLILAGFSEMSESVDRFVQPLMYLTLPLSGTFTMMSWLPEEARAFLLYSPLVHGTEMFRKGFMGDGFTFHFDPWYLLACGIGTVVIGLAVVKKAEGHFHHV